MDRIDENGTKSEDDYASQYLNSLDDKIDNKNYDNVDFTSYNGKQQLDLAYKFFNNNQFENLYKLLKTVQNLDIFSLMDKKNYTLVHRIVLNQSIEHLKFALEYVRKYLYSNQYPGTEIETQIIEWLNFKTDGGFTALHYASYRGDIKIIQYLIQNGADFQAKNSKGLNAIHIAAQGDQPISIRYFQKIGLNTDDLDFKQGNPLHWACFLGNENAIHYLTSFTDIDINQPDQQGLSPLHLAVISGNARAVKRLLLKGADRTIKDKQDKTAGFLANEQGYENIANMIDTEDGFEEYCNLRQPFRPIKKSVKQVVIFYFLFLFIQALFIAFILPCLDSEFIEFGTWAVISSLTLVFQVSVWFANPGEVSGINNKETLTNSFKAKRLNEFSCVSSAEGTFNKNSMKQNSYNKQTSAPNNDQYQSVDSIIDLKQPHSVKLLEESKSQADEIKIRLEEPLLGLEGDKIQKDELILLFKAFPIDQICMDCQIIKPQRSKHCEVCKKCIRVYDHHCPWVNNCVGVNNYKYFISFIVALWLSKLALLTLTCIHITTEYDQANDIFFNWYQNVSNDETMHIIFIVKYVAAAVIISITLPFFVMLTVLCFVQINNLFLNQTTYERFNSSKKNDGLGDSSSLISSRDPNQNLDSEMFSANSPMKDQSNNKKNDMKKKKSKSGNSILRRFSFHNAFQMCCLNKKNHLLDFNKNICMRQISIQDKDPETSFY